MKKQFKVKGMSCNHCRASVEKALNSVEGLKAEVTLDPPVATVESDRGDIITSELQETLSRAGDYEIWEM